jgi:tetratricopeptide (TPR) repeat protein
VDLSTGVDRRRSDVEMGPVLGGLRETFELMAAGEDVPARRRLYQLALEIEKTYGNEGMKALGRAQIRTLERLAETSGAEVVIPVLSLDLALYREARERGRSLISSNARLLILRLVDLYIELAGNSEEAERTAANVLVSLGGELQSADMIYFSVGLFRRALSLDSSQRVALLALGMTYQVSGDMQRAIDAFGTLADEYEDPQALVRLAVLKEQDGSPREARKLFSRAIRAPGAPDWIASLAYQELGRLHLDAGDLDEATELLEQAVKRLPQEPRLRYLQAFVHRAAGREDAARAVVAKIGPASDRRISARSRFDEWPQESFVEANSMLHARTDRARGLLAGVARLEEEEK